MGCASSSQTATTPEGGYAQDKVDITKRLSPPGKFPVVGPGTIMKRREHGTSSKPVQETLRFGCDFRTADRICNFNRHHAEHLGYFTRKKDFYVECEYAKREKRAIKFYDSNTGKLLFEAPKSRSVDDFILESKRHGWPSFRDEEVNWDQVRCLKNGECVSLAGTHLGHNLPDRTGNRYCINLVSIAGHPVAEEEEKPEASTQ